MSVSVLGGGAFGTALAIALSREGAAVTLWARDAEDIAAMARSRQSGRNLPGFDLPESLTLEPGLAHALAETVLLALPTQKLGAFLAENSGALDNRALVACCKGVDRGSGLGPVDLIAHHVPGARSAVLTGPSFAVDIAAGLPTAVVLAASTGADGLQVQLTRKLLRIYATSDTIGAQLGGAMKNVFALAAGMAIGAGLGDSARAAVIARGFAEMTRYATAKGAEAPTLAGLSGLGDLVLTCTSEKSRNFTAGLALGRGNSPPSGTVEGIATAEALAAATADDDLPITHAVHDIAEGRRDVREAVDLLLSRPVRKE